MNAIKRNLLKVIFIIPKVPNDNNSRAIMGPRFVDINYKTGS